MKKIELYLDDELVEGLEKLHEIHEEPFITHQELIKHLIFVECLNKKVISC